MSAFDPEVYVEALHSADTPTLITDLNFIVQDINRAGEVFTNYSREEIVGEPVTVIAGDDTIYDDIVDALVRGESWTGDFPLQGRNGSVVYGRGSAAPITIDEKTRGYVAMFVDTTKQRRYASTSKVLSRLLRHDLRNELNLMYGYLESAIDYTEHENQERALASLRGAKEQVERIVHHTEHVRDLRALLEQSYDAESHAMNIGDVLEERVTAARERFPEAEFRFESSTDSHVYADDLLPAALDALLENAVIHNDTEDPVVVVDTIDRGSDVVIKVLDNGPGVPADQRDLIFGREEVDKLNHGTGLGLFMADSIISNYDGAIWVEDNDPRGSIFAVRLPQTFDDENDENDEDGPRSGISEPLR